MTVGHCSVDTKPGLWTVDCGLDTFGAEMLSLGPEEAEHNHNDLQMCSIFISTQIFKGLLFLR